MASLERICSRKFSRKSKYIPMSDIEIARAAPIKPISEIADRLGIPNDSLVPFGHTKAKVNLEYIDSLKEKSDAKLILVTAITPTPAGEGKTTTSVGLTAVSYTHLTLPTTSRV